MLSCQGTCGGGVLLDRFKLQATIHPAITKIGKSNESCFLKKAFKNSFSLSSSLSFWHNALCFSLKCHCTIKTRASIIFSKSQCFVALRFTALWLRGGGHPQSPPCLHVYLYEGFPEGGPEIFEALTQAIPRLTTYSLLVHRPACPPTTRWPDHNFFENGRLVDYPLPVVHGPFLWSEVIFCWSVDWGRGGTNTRPKPRDNNKPRYGAGHGSPWLPAAGVLAPPGQAAARSPLFGHSERPFLDHSLWSEKCHLVWYLAKYKSPCYIWPVFFFFFL